MVPTTATTYQLFLGRKVDTPQFGPDEYVIISDEEFQEFVRFNIASRFKSFSIVDGISYWKGESELVSIVTIVSEQYWDAIDINKIAKEYGQRFKQEAVFINSLASFPNLVTHV